VGLRRVVRVFALALEGVFGRGGAEASTLAVEQRHADAEGSEVYSRYDGHVLHLFTKVLRKRFIILA
jgi:hypothetical protein